MSTTHRPLRERLADANATLARMDRAAMAGTTPSFPVKVMARPFPMRVRHPLTGEFVEVRTSAKLRELFDLAMQEARK